MRTVHRIYAYPSASDSDGEWASSNLATVRECVTVLDRHSDGGEEEERTLGVYMRVSPIPKFFVSYWAPKETRTHVTLHTRH